MRDVDFIRASFIHQRGPFERTLPSTDDEDAFASIEFKIRRVARMDVRSGRQLFYDFAWVVFEEREAETKQDLICTDLRTIVQRCCIGAICTSQMSHIGRLRYQRVLPHEPACIIEKRIEWDRSDLLRSELAFIHIRLERRRFLRIKAPVWPDRKNMPRGMFVFQKLSGLPMTSTSTPSDFAYAATAMLYGPAPITRKGV